MFFSFQVRRDIQERGRDLAGVLHQYEYTVKPAFDKFVYPVSNQNKTKEKKKPNHDFGELCTSETSNKVTRIQTLYLGDPQQQQAYTEPILNQMLIVISLSFSLSLINRQ
jgi:hypothetical protein